MIIMIIIIIIIIIIFIMLIYTTDIIGGTQAGFGLLRAGAPKSRA